MFHKDCIALSMGQLEEVYDDPVATESWGISSAFLNGMQHNNVMKMACKLSYEAKELRTV